MRVSTLLVVAPVAAPPLGSGARKPAGPSGPSGSVGEACSAARLWPPGVKGAGTAGGWPPEAAASAPVVALAGCVKAVLIVIPLSPLRIAQEQARTVTFA